MSKIYAAKYNISELGGNYQLSPHFKLYEFKCQDGSDTVYVSGKLLEKLEELRSYLGNERTRIIIISAYRSFDYNYQVNGAADSWHCYGWAVDVQVYVDGMLLEPKYVCCLAQDLGFKGIGAMRSTTHLDMRPTGSYRGDERKGGKKTYKNNVNNDFYNYFGVTKTQIKNLKGDEEEMTQAQFNKMFEAAVEERNKKNDVSKYAVDSGSWEWGKKQGICDGTMPKGFCTREQAVEMLSRVIKKLK